MVNVYRDRRELLELGLLPRHAVCAEVGVCKGVFTSMIAEYTTPKLLHAIDAWAGLGACGSGSVTDKRSLGRLLTVSQMLQPAIKAGRAVLHQGLSGSVLSLFPRDYFDWVYVDADHSYEGVLSDLLAVEPTIKAGGLIAGHDICLPGDEHKVYYHFPGVARAVDDFCHRRGLCRWRISAITTAGPNEEPDPAGRNCPSYILERA